MPALLPHGNDRNRDGDLQLPGAFTLPEHGVLYGGLSGVCIFPGAGGEKRSYTQYDLKRCFSWNVLPLRNFCAA